MNEETTYLVEIGAPEPASALSLLRRRIVAIDADGPDGRVQVGTASDFHLQDLEQEIEPTMPGEIETPLPRKVPTLVARVHLDAAKLDAVRHLLASQQGQMYVGSYPLKRAVGA